MSLVFVPVWLLRQLYCRGIIQLSCSLELHQPPRSQAVTECCSSLLVAFMCPGSVLWITSPCRPEIRPRKMSQRLCFSLSICDVLRFLGSARLCLCFRRIRLISAYLSVSHLQQRLRPSCQLLLHNMLSNCRARKTERRREM